MVNPESLNRQKPQMTPKPVPIFGRSKVTSSIVTTLNLGFNCTCRRKKHSLLKCFDFTRSTHTDLDVLQGKRSDDHWNVDSSKHLSDSWRGFTQFTLLKEKPLKGDMWSAKRLTKIQTTTRPDHLWPDVRQCSKNERNLLYRTDDEEYKEILKKNARRKLERPMAPTMPCKRLLQHHESGCEVAKLHPKRFQKNAS